MAHERRLDRTEPTGAEIRSISARTALPSARAWATCPPRENGCVSRCRSKSSSWRLAPKSTAGHSLSSTARFTGIKPESKPGHRKMASSMIRSRPGSGIPCGPEQVAACPRTSRRSPSLRSSKRNEAQARELIAYFIEHAYSKTAKLLEPLDAKVELVQRHRKELEEQLPDHARLSREGRRAQARVSAQARRI